MREKERTEVPISLALRSAPRPFNNDLPLHSYLSIVKCTNPPLSASFSSFFLLNLIVSFLSKWLVSPLGSLLIIPTFAVWLPVLFPALFIHFLSPYWVTLIFTRKRALCLLSTPTKQNPSFTLSRVPFMAKLPERTVYPFCLHVLTSHFLLKSPLYQITLSKGSVLGALFFTHHNGKTSKFSKQELPFPDSLLLLLIFFSAIFSPSLHNRVCFCV